jgi:hypothetical protein
VGGGYAGFTWNVGGSSGAIVVCPISARNTTVAGLYPLTHAPTGITTDGTTFYWSNENAGTIESAPAGGGSVSSPPLLSGLSNPVGMATASPNSFFYAEGSTVGLWTAGTPAQVCMSGLTFPYFIGSSFMPPMPDGGVVFAGPPSVAVADLIGNAVYWAPMTACSSTSGPVQVASGLVGPQTATTDGTTVFFGTRGNGSTPGQLYACPNTGCTPQNNPTPYQANTGFVNKVVLDGPRVIWSANNGVVECAKSGCTTPTVLASSAFTSALAAEAGFVYYVEGGTLYVVAE